MASFIITKDQLSEISEQIDTVKSDGSGSLDVSSLKTALEICGYKLPQYKIRVMIEELEKHKPTKEKGVISVQELNQLCADLKAKDVAGTFKTQLVKRENLQTIGGMSAASSEGTTHSVRHEEQVAFSDWVNTNLRTDIDLKHLLPIDPEGRTLYESVKDGILLCKIINHSCPDTIDERAINKKNLTLYTKHENLTLALNSAQAIGCNIINIDAHDLSKGKPHLVLGLLWQIIRIGLFNQITLENCPGLVQLVLDGEELQDLLRLSPESILIRWVNYHLERAGSNRRISNFTSDIKDSEAYTILLTQIAPPGAGVSAVALHEGNLLRRAELMLQEADKLNCRHFLAPQDVVDGNYKLNVAFVANLFNNHPALDKPDEPLELENIEESREEKTYRNWMNSMGVNPYVNWLYSDLADGLIVFQLFDIIKPGIVSWTRVHKSFNRMKAFIQKIENCNYAVELGKELKFSLVGIAGQDIYDGNTTLTLAIVWQLMRAYTLSVLTKLASDQAESEGGKPHAIVEKEIVEWANRKLQEAGKQSSIKSFQDQSISTGRALLDLIDAIKPGAINYSQSLAGDTPEEKLANSKYAISMARKIGARVYALPEDIAEVKHKMVMTVFACLMARDYVPGLGRSLPSNSTSSVTSSTDSILNDSTTKATNGANGSTNGTNGGAASPVARANGSGTPPVRTSTSTPLGGDESASSLEATNGNGSLASSES